MRSVLLSAAIRMVMAGMAKLKISSADRYNLAESVVVRQRFGRSPPRPSDFENDPYFGIKSTGRRGARHRARMMAEAFRFGRVSQQDRTADKRPQNQGDAAYLARLARDRKWGRV